MVPRNGRAIYLRDRQGCRNFTRSKGPASENLQRSFRESPMDLEIGCSPLTARPINFAHPDLALLSHLPEFVQRSQIIRSRLISEGLRPVGPRHLADIEVAAAVHREPVRRQEIGRAKARTNPTQPGNALARVVDDGDPRAKVRPIAATRVSLAG